MNSSTSTTTDTTSSSPRGLRKSPSTLSRRSAKSFASLSSLRSPASLQQLSNREPVASKSLVTVEVEMKRARTSSMTSREGLEILRDSHDEAVKKRAIIERRGANSQKSWFGSSRKTLKTSSLSAEMVFDSAQPLASPESTSSTLVTPQTTPVLGLDPAAGVAISTSTGDGIHTLAEGPSSLETLRGGACPQEEGTPPSRKSWLLRKDPPVISVTNPTPTNSPSKQSSSHPLHHHHTPPNPSPLSESFSNTTPRLPGQPSRRGSVADKQQGGGDLLSPSRMPPPRSIPIPPPPSSRPASLAFSPTTVTSIDSHVPTIGTLSPPDSPTRPRQQVIVPAPALPPSISGWDSIRPRLSIPLLGRRKVPVEDFVTPFDNHEKGEAPEAVISHPNGLARRPSNSSTKTLEAKPTETAPPSNATDLIDAKETANGMTRTEAAAPVQVEPSFTSRETAAEHGTVHQEENSATLSSSPTSTSTVQQSTSWFYFFSRTSTVTASSSAQSDELAAEAKTGDVVDKDITEIPQSVGGSHPIVDERNETRSIASHRPDSVKSVPVTHESDMRTEPQPTTTVADSAPKQTSSLTPSAVNTEGEQIRESASPPGAGDGWFGWWAWGGSSTSIVSDVGAAGTKHKETPDAGAALNGEKPQDGHERQLTEAEQIKEAALARDTSPTLVEPTEARAPETAIVKGAPEPPPGMVVGPSNSSTHGSQESLLMSTPAARASWVSFFTSNASLRNWSQKRIEGGSAKTEEAAKEVDGEEVMTIDFTAEGEQASNTDAKSMVSTSEVTRGREVSSAGAASRKQSPRPAPSKSVPRPKTPEPSKDKPQPPLTESNKAKKEVSVTPSPKTRSRSGSPSPPSLKRPSQILPSFEDTFNIAPRSTLPTYMRVDKSKNKISKGVGLLKTGVSTLSGYLLGVDIDLEELEKKQFQKKRVQRLRAMSQSGQEEVAPERKPTGDPSVCVYLDKDGNEIGVQLPRHLGVFNKYGMRKSPEVIGKGKAKESEPEGMKVGYLDGCKRIVIIGIHGWFPGTLVRSVFGAPTGTSAKFASMMTTAVIDFIEEHVEEDMRGGFKITSIPLEGEGTITNRVNKLYDGLFASQEWVSALHDADVIFVATHSQGSIVSTLLLDRLVQEGHISMEPSRYGGDIAGIPVNMDAGIGPKAERASRVNSGRARRGQRVCLLAMCGIHLGPFRHLIDNVVSKPYLQLFESAAATELFQFQDTENEISNRYVQSLERVLDSGIKCVYIASLNDQVVPIYSGVFAAAAHPSILRGLYIDGDAYSSSDFLTNLLVLLLRIRNAGLDDNGLLAHLSEATAGSLNGIGHSIAYDDLQTYSLAVRYLFETTGVLSSDPKPETERTRLRVDSFQAAIARNDYEIPWALREVIAYESGLFEQEWQHLARAFSEWHPKTTILREMKKKLQPIQRLKKANKL